MSSNLVLVVALVVIWGAAALLGRRTVSIVPMFPFVPAVLVVVGIAVNGWVNWAGTIAVAVLHVIVVGVVGVGFLRERRMNSDTEEKP
jgi:hypothetical protein